MPAHDDSSDYDNAEFVALLASLDLREPSPTPPTLLLCTPPPRTPSPQPPAYSAGGHTFPSARPRMYTTTSSPTVYHYTSPTRSGHTSSWSVAGAATQGVAHASVHTIQRGPNSRKHTKKAAYVVFCGLRCGVFLTWAQTRPHAHAAFAYAQARTWTRCTRDVDVPPTPQLPQPLLSSDSSNPLNGGESLDDRWYVVYRGITPGVYRSYLESQLNTLGVPGALHESVAGHGAALIKYNSARQRGDVATVAPAYYALDESDDVFM
ncbi:hypothetical protein C8R44DRAFT_874591 [Mycena epipterygia]|nr:hypothetical protein C8R44DRAFT_874591 [Mycena epipterygia]